MLPLLLAMKISIQGNLPRYAPCQLKPLCGFLFLETLIGFSEGLKLFFQYSDRIRIVIFWYEWYSAYAECAKDYQSELVPA